MAETEHIQAWESFILQFAALKAKFRLGNKAFLTYAQLKSILDGISTSGWTIGGHCEIDEKLEVFARGRETVSKLYRLSCLSSSNCNILTQLQWHRDLGINLTSFECKGLWRNSLSMSKCVRYKVMQLKIMHRAYFTPAKLHKMDHNVSDKCRHGCGVGTPFSIHYGTVPLLNPCEVAHML